MQDAKVAPLHATPAVTLEEIIISSELPSRPMRSPDVVAEASAMQDLTSVMAEGDVAVFRALTILAMRLCDAGSAGVSVIEEGPSGSVFRWRVLAGVIQSFEGGCTPRDWSPCGACLDRGQATLYSHPDRHFTYLQALGMPIVEALVVPMLGHGKNGSTIWIVSHGGRPFDAEDVRVMTALSCYAARSLGNAPGATDAAPAMPGTGREMVWRAYVEKIVRGDERSLHELFQETSPLVFATVIRILGFAADAEEVTTDVYARVWATASTYHPERGTIVSWLRTIARSMAFDRLRASALRARSEVSLRADLRGGADIEDDLIAGQAHEFVLAALGALPSVQRRAIELAYLSGLTCPEIAVLTGEPVGTIKTRLRLGLIKLRRLLASAASSEIRDGGTPPS